MPEERKRVNVYVGDDWQQISAITEYLTDQGVDAKLVTRYAVQVHPDHARQAAQLAGGLVAWVERENEKRKGVGNA